MRDNLRGGLKSNMKKQFFFLVLLLSALLFSIANATPPLTLNQKIEASYSTTKNMLESMSSRIKRTHLLKLSNYHQLMLLSWDYNLLRKTYLMPVADSRESTGFISALSAKQKKNDLNVVLTSIQKPDSINPLMVGTIWGYAVSNFSGTKLDLRYNFD